MRNLAMFFVLCLLCFRVLAAGRPNVVFILADDLGINDLNCYGRADHHTPNLDNLARQGTRFISAYCAQPICSPSRLAILTGKTPARLHLTTYLPGRPDTRSQRLLHPKIRGELPLEEMTLAEHLKRAGYASGYFGKWHLGGKGFLPTDQGFDLYHPGQANTVPSETEGGKGEYDLTRRAAEFIAKNRDRPFLVYLAHNSPHIPYTARAQLVTKNGAAFEPVYAALIETLDDSIGQLLTTLRSLGLDEKTIVIFTSDNGGLHVPEGGHAKVTHNSPFRAGKGFLYEGGLRIPLIVRWPGKIPAGRVIDSPVINTDWLPTLSELAGIEIPAGLDGQSIAPLLLEKAEPPRRKFFWHFPHYTNQGSNPAGAAREGEWKLIEHYEDHRVELYDLRSDPAEKLDRAAFEPDRVRDLRKALDDWRRAVGAQSNRENPDFDSDLHRAIYKDYDISKYEPARAGADGLQRVLEWRKKMDAAVRAASQRR